MLIVPRPRQVQELEIDGQRPFAKWLKKLKDIRAKAAILSRITKIEALGSFGNYRYLDDGVFELKIDVGQGYRTYFGLDGNTLVIIICGGDKSSQDRDIKKAKKLWNLFETTKQVKNEKK